LVWGWRTSASVCFFPPLCLGSVASPGDLFSLLGPFVRLVFFNPPSWAKPLACAFPSGPFFFLVVSLFPFSGGENRYGAGNVFSFGFCSTGRLFPRFRIFLVRGGVPSSGCPAFVRRSFFTIFYNCNEPVARLVRGSCMQTLTGVLSPRGRPCFCSRYVGVFLLKVAGAFCFGLQSALAGTSPEVPLFEIVPLGTDVGVLALLSMVSGVGSFFPFFFFYFLLSNWRCDAAPNLFSFWASCR